jgi:hypothetical protein
VLEIAEKLAISAAGALACILLFTREDYRRHCPLRQRPSEKSEHEN